MTTLQPKTVKNVVTTWDILFGGKRSDAEMVVICSKFYAALRNDFSNEAFLIAAEMIEKETNFFPTIKGLMDCRESVRQVIESRPADYGLLAITDDAGEMSPEIIEQNEKRLKVIRDMLCGKLGVNDAVKEQENLRHYTRR